MRRSRTASSGADANARDDCRLAAASLTIDQYWATAVDGYRAPQLIIVDVEAATGCGTASNATGPFYCPPDETVYVDPTFFALLRERFDATAGPLAQLYVLAHEYGHHVQNITGIMQEHPDNGTGEDSNSVRTELQADCFAGAWVGRRRRAEGRERGPVPAGADRSAGARCAGRRGRRRRRPHPARVRRPRQPGGVDPRIERAAAAVVHGGVPGRPRSLRHFRCARK